MFTQRLCQQRNRMLAALAGGHLNLPLAGFAVRHHDIRAALLNLTEQRGADRLRRFVVFTLKAVGSRNPAAA
jgi:hypothetical protein